jgi:DNA-binding LacI/PurR family transcriptional regulator
MKKVTIVDIAKICNVSMKTVSRVLNNSPNVSDKTKQKVYAAMKEHGYQVNMLAKGLKGNRTNIIVVFVDRHNEEHLSIWHNIMLKYLFRYGKERAMKIVVSPSNSDKFEEDETDGFYLIANGIADGAILLENVTGDSRIEYFEQRGIHYVVFGEPRNNKIPSVSLDNYDVGYKGGEYLNQKGYKRIAFFIGEEKFLSTQLRIQGFKDSVLKSNIKYNIYPGVDTIEKAYRKAIAVLQKEEVDAFFISGDERAVGVYRGIYESGFRIPQDIAVLGIDNINLGAYLYPPISTVEQDFKSMAKTCIDFVVGRIEGTSDGICTVKFPSAIIEREST